MPSVTERHTGLTWEAVCTDPNLQDLPYKIETNEWGQIVMSPTRIQHGAYQFAIGRLLEQHLAAGKVITEAAIRTTKGTKVADVAWCSDERWEQVKADFDAHIAPEICVEVRSPDNALGEIEQKRHLYVEAGAREVWTCDAERRMQFFDADGPLAQSALAPAFPRQITL